MPPIKKNIALCVVLSILTCGVYGIYWLYTMIDFMYRAPNTQNRWTTSPAATILLMIVTCGIYGVYVEYKWGKQMPEIFAAYGIQGEDRSTLYLVLCLFGFSIVNHCLIQNDINILAERAGGGPNYGQSYSQQAPQNYTQQP